MGESMIHIPPRRPLTPEEQETARVQDLIVGLHNRIRTKTIQPGDELLILQYTEQLQDLQKRFERFYNIKYG